LKPRQTLLYAILVGYASQLFNIKICKNRPEKRCAIGVYSLK
jgi:hypothetical protein